MIIERNFDTSNEVTVEVTPEQWDKLEIIYDEIAECCGLYQFAKDIAQAAIANYIIDNKIFIADYYEKKAKQYLELAAKYGGNLNGRYI